MDWSALLGCSIYILVPVLLAVPGLLVLNSRKAVYKVGAIVTGAIFLFGLLLSLLATQLALSTGGDPAIAILEGVFLTSIATAPPLVTTLIYGRYLK